MAAPSPKGSALVIAKSRRGIRAVVELIPAVTDVCADTALACEVVLDQSFRGRSRAELAHGQSPVRVLHHSRGLGLLEDDLPLSTVRSSRNTATGTQSTNSTVALPPSSFLPEFNIVRIRRTSSTQPLHPYSRVLPAPSLHPITGSKCGDLSTKGRQSLAGLPPCDSARPIARCRSPRGCRWFSAAFAAFALGRFAVARSAALVVIATVRTTPVRALAARTALPRLRLPTGSADTRTSSRVTVRCDLIELRQNRLCTSAEVVLHFLALKATSIVEIVCGAAVAQQLTRLMHLVWAGRSIAVTRPARRFYPADPVMSDSAQR